MVPSIVAEIAFSQYLENDFVILTLNVVASIFTSTRSGQQNGNYYNSKPSETIRNHPKPSKTIRNQPKFLAINHKLPGISYNQPQTTRNLQQPATKWIWLILSCKMLELYTTIFPKLLKNNEYSYFHFYCYCRYYYYCYQYRNIRK